MFFKKAVKTYFLKLLGIITSIVSYGIVIPKISSNIEAYGVYSVVASLLIFLSYADLGFLGATQKYAAEKFAINDLLSEIKILSFGHFILICAILIYGILLIYLYFNPEIIFNNSSFYEINLAKKLILIFIYSSPLIFFQRYISAIFQIRIEEYIYQCVDIVGNVIKIISTFYFFKSFNYQIVDYIIFIQIISLFSVVVNLFIINYKYDYNFKLVIQYLKFNHQIYDLTKKMALTSILASISWIIYYECDTLYISKIYNSKIAGFFAIGLTMLTLIRTVMSTFFAPFQTKFNYLKGQKNHEAISLNFAKVVEFSIPISIILPIGLIVLMKPLIHSWVGFEFEQSIIVSRILISSLFFSFLSGPISLVALSNEKYKFILINSLLLPFFYFFFYFILSFKFGILSLPIAKVLTIFCSFLINLFLFKSLINFPLKKLLSKIFRETIIPVFILVLLLFFTRSIWNINSGKNIYNLIIVILTGGFCITFSSFSYYYINKNTRNTCFFLLNNVYSKLF